MFFKNSIVNTHFKFQVGKEVGKNALVQTPLYGAIREIKSHANTTLSLLLNTSYAFRVNNLTDSKMLWNLLASDPQIFFSL